MTDRVIAIGDIHGCSTALASLVRAIDPRPEDTLVVLGDLGNRGLDTKGVIDLLIDLGRECKLVAVAGNHDEAMLNARRDKAAFRFWLEMGGVVTLDAYGDSGRLSLIPSAHWRFLESCVSYYQTPTHFFVHANYDAHLPLDRQSGRTLRWLSLHDHLPPAHVSGKIAVVGHTPQAEVLNAGHLIALDTNCCDGGWLSALDVGTGQLWQADERGRLR